MNNDLFKVMINDIKEEPKGTKSFYFAIPDGMSWGAGADIHVAHPDFMSSNQPDKSLIRHMSIMTLPEEGKLGITTRVPGSGSDYKRRLGSLAIGDELVLFKLGNRIPLRREGRPVVLISMGVGTATMRPMLLSWSKDPTGIPSVTNLVVSRPRQFVFRDELESLTERALVQNFSDDRKDFYRDLNERDFEADSIFFIVGSDNFLIEVIQQLKARGINPDSIEVDLKPDKRALIIEGVR